MDIRLQFSLTPEDYREFNLAHRKIAKSLLPASQRGILSRRLPVLIFVAVAVGLVYAVRPLVSPPAAAAPPAAPAAPAVPGEYLKEFLAAFFPYLIPIAFVFGVFVWLRRSKMIYRRAFADNPKMMDPQTVRIRDTRLAVRLPSLLSIHRWNSFIRFYETPGTFLLFTSNRTAQILPKRAFRSPDSVAEFRAFAQAHVGNTVIGFPVEVVEAK